MQWQPWRRGERCVLVGPTSSEPRLWLDERGDLQDAIGPVRVYERDGACAAELPAEELAVFVAEWLACVTEREGPVALNEIHPTLRALVYELTPSAIQVGDDDVIEVVSS